MLEIDRRPARNEQHEPHERCYRGPERRFAFFPRRLQRNGPDPAQSARPGGERRCGDERRRHNGRDVGSVD